MNILLTVQYFFSFHGGGTQNGDEETGVESGNPGRGRLVRVTQSPMGSSETMSLGSGGFRW